MKKLFILLQFVSLVGFSQATFIIPNSVTIPNVAANPTCDANSKGKQIFNTTTNKMYYCNGSTWIDLSAVSLTLPYTGTASNVNPIFSLTNSGGGKALKTSGVYNSIILGKD